MALNVEALDVHNIKYYLDARKDLGQDRLNSIRAVWLDFTSILPSSLKDPLRDHDYFTDQDFNTAAQRNIWYTEPIPTGSLTEKQLEKDPRWRLVKNSKILCDLSKESKNVPSYQNMYELDFFKILRDKVQGITRDRRRTRTNFYYDAFKSSENRVWSEVDHLRQQFEYARDLPTPAPTHAFHFPMFPFLFVKNEWLRANTHSFLPLCGDTVNRNFRTEILRHLSEHGLVSRVAGFKDPDPTSAQTGCFPWLVADIANPSTEYDKDLCYRRAVNAASASLLMYENVAKFAEHKSQQQHIPPIPVLTAVGSVVRLWIAYTEFDHKGRNHHIETVWQGNITNIVDALCLRTLLENLHTWAMRVLRPQLSTYIDQWLHHFPYAPKSQREMRSQQSISSMHAHFGSDVETRRHIEPSINRVLDLLSNVVQLHPQSPHRAPLAQLLKGIFADEYLVIKKKVEAEQKLSSGTKLGQSQVQSTTCDESAIGTSRNSFSFNVDKWLKTLNDSQDTPKSTAPIAEAKSSLFSADAIKQQDKGPYLADSSQRQSRTRKGWHGRMPCGRSIKVRLPPVSPGTNKETSITTLDNPPIWDKDAIPVLASDRAKRIAKDSPRTILMANRPKNKKPEHPIDDKSAPTVKPFSKFEFAPFAKDKQQTAFTFSAGWTSTAGPVASSDPTHVPIFGPTEPMKLLSDPGKPVVPSQLLTESVQHKVNEIDKKPSFDINVDHTETVTHNEKLFLMSDMEALALGQGSPASSAAGPAIDRSKDKADKIDKKPSVPFEIDHTSIPSPVELVELISDDEVPVLSVPANSTVDPAIDGLKDEAKGSDNEGVRAASKATTPTSSPESTDIVVVAIPEQPNLGQEVAAEPTTEGQDRTPSLFPKSQRPFQWDFGHSYLKPLPSEARATSLDSPEKSTIFKLGTVDFAAALKGAKAREDLHHDDRSDSTTYMGAKKPRGYGHSPSIEEDKVHAEPATTADLGESESLFQYQKKVDGLFANLKLDAKWNKKNTMGLVEDKLKQSDDEGDPMIIDTVVTSARLPTPQPSPRLEEDKISERSSSAGDVEHATLTPGSSILSKASFTPTEAPNESTPEETAPASLKE